MVRLAVRRWSVVVDLLDKHGWTVTGDRGDRGRRLHGLDHWRSNALLMQVDDILRGDWRRESRSLDVVGDKLWIDSSSAHCDDFIHGGDAWRDRSTQLRSDDRSILSRHFVHLSAKYATGQSTESSANGRASAGVTRLAADDRAGACS